MPEGDVVFEEEPVFDSTLIPRVQMPFDVGVAVLCSQGNSSEPGRTHALPQNRHALDFSNRVLPEVPVVAAASGVVVYVVVGARNNSRDGGGYGSQVRVLHEHGLFTLYAHLEEVFVNVGDRLTAGQRLGTMGQTGLAGDRHLHFSLHLGPFNEDGVPPTLEIPEIATLDGPLSSGAFRCSSKEDPWSGGLYAAESSLELEPEVRSALREMEATTLRRSRLHRYSRASAEVSVVLARQFLEPIVAEAPEDPVAQYGWAVEVEIPLGRLAAARSHLDRAERALDDPAVDEPWIRAWLENQRGAIALGEQEWLRAEAHFARAEALLGVPAVREFARRQRARAGVEGSARPIAVANQQRAELVGAAGPATTFR